MNLREASKREYSYTGSIEHINAGSLQRIADATEKMTQKYEEAIAERDQAYRTRDYWRDLYARYHRKCVALRGVITRMKKAQP